MSLSSRIAPCLQAHHDHRHYGHHSHNAAIIRGLPPLSSLTSLLLAVLLSTVAVAGAPSMDSRELTSYGYYNDRDNHGMGDYLTDYNHKWGTIGRIRSPRCLDIPSNLTLCSDIGYRRMMLPNLLDHDTLTEVTHQAQSWVPLLRIDCHPDTNVFLCSLFSPVCLDRFIYPCRSLCESVRANCAYRMKPYGFDWPEMLKCDKFPVDNDMCIKLIHDKIPDHKCEACKHPERHESIIDNFCRSDFVIRATVKAFEMADGNKVLQLRKKKKFYKKGNLTKSEMRSLEPIIEDGEACSCDMINATHKRYILMGSRKNGKMALNFGMIWKKKDKEFRKGLRAIRKKETCEAIVKELSTNGTLNKHESSKSGGRKGKGKGKGKGKKNRKKSKKNRKNKKKKKGRRGKKGKKGDSENSASRRNKNAASKSEIEDRAMSNFSKAAN